MTFSKKFKTGIVLSILVVIAIALFDVLAAQSGVFGTVEEYTIGNFTQGWWDLFYKFNLVLLLCIPISYYFFAKRDLSESIALFLNSYVLWFAGLADLFYFILQGRMIPQIYPWLNGHPVMSIIASALGSEQVTRTAVLISVALGFVVIYAIDKQLERI